MCVNNWSLVEGFAQEVKLNKWELDNPKVKKKME